VKRACSALLITLLIFAATPATALAGPDNVAVAINEKDGSSLFKLSFTVLRISGDDVAPSNVAVAVGSCSNCRTVAIALQVVLVLDDPSTISPLNMAIAINENCLQCLTAAAAYQLVVSAPSDRFKFTKEAKEQIKDIQDEFEMLLEGDLPIDLLLAETDALALELFTLVMEEIVSGGRFAQEKERDVATDDGAAGEPIPSPSGSPSGSQEPSPEPTPSGSSSQEGSPSPTPEPSSSSSP
jgi:putative peptide zinc metalloprotease protein